MQGSAGISDDANSEYANYKFTFNHTVFDIANGQQIVKIKASVADMQSANNGQTLEDFI